jgi:hypothetical protein
MCRRTYKWQKLIQKMRADGHILIVEWIRNKVWNAYKYGAHSYSINISVSSFTSNGLLGTVQVWIRHSNVCKMCGFWFIFGLMTRQKAIAKYIKMTFCNSASIKTDQKTTAKTH